MTSYLRLLVFGRPYWRRLLAAGLSALIVSLMTAATAWLVKPVLDDIFIKRDETMLVLLPLALICVTAAKGLASFAQSYLMSYAAYRIVTDIRGKLYHHMLLLPIRFHEKHSTGKLLSRVLNDVGLLQNAVSGVVKDFLQHGITLIALICVVLYQDWRMALAALAVIPLSYYPMVRLGRRLRKIARSGQERIADVTTTVQEALSGIKVVKSFGMEGYEVEKFRQRNWSYFKSAMRGVQIVVVTSPLMEVLGVLGIAAIIWYGGYQVIEGKTTPGTFFSFMTACFFMYTPLRRLSQASNSFQQVLAAAERVFQVLDERTEKDTMEGWRDLPQLRHQIEFRNISFRYEGISQPALSGIDLSVKSGEIIALVGSSGSGKTTLANLLPRFYDPAGGTILIDGVDIREATLESLRRQIGIVQQETILFDDTVKRNIAYGLDDIEMDKVIEAAKAAYAHQFIIKMPQGYDTVIGERGVMLSGGERQRFAIARAILRNPPILILDEATSALDSESEYVVQKALQNLMQHRTTLVIAHRLSTIQNAAHIIVLDAGRIVETGTHKELLKKNGVYKKLYQMQFREEEPQISGASTQS